MHAAPLSVQSSAAKLGFELQERTNKKLANKARCIRCVPAEERTKSSQRLSDGSTFRGLVRACRAATSQAVIDHLRLILVRLI